MVTKHILSGGGYSMKPSAQVDECAEGVCMHNKFLGGYTPILTSQGLSTWWELVLLSDSFYIPLNVSETAPPFMSSCKPQEIHSLHCEKRTFTSFSCPQQGSNLGPPHDRHTQYCGTSWKSNLCSSLYFGLKVQEGCSSAG